MNLILSRSQLGSGKGNHANIILTCEFMNYKCLKILPSRSGKV